ncbi:MAG: hypothetical protein U0547_07840 [Dehalococcoidia bacterium]
MKGLGRKTSLLLVLAVIATALTGAAYSLWYEDVAVNAQVATGNLDVTWKLQYCRENEDANKTGQNFDEGFVWQSKQVGNFTESSYPADSLVLNVTGAYPGYAVDCKLDFVNLGNVPVHVEREYLDFDLDNDGDFDDLHIECTAGPSLPQCRNLDPVANPWTNTANTSPIFTRWTNGLGCQLHQNEPSSGDLFIGIRQPAAENTTYRVRFTVQFNQWNESGWTNCSAPKNVPVTPVTHP